jgi:hypothetical protein
MNNTPHPREQKYLSPWSLCLCGELVLAASRLRPNNGFTTEGTESTEGKHRENRASTNRDQTSSISTARAAVLLLCGLCALCGAIVLSASRAGPNNGFTTESTEGKHRENRASTSRGQTTSIPVERLAALSSVVSVLSVVNLSLGSPREFID